jgi:hypothetical protein
MIEINKWSIALGILGVFTSISSTIRWFFMYPDTSQFVIGFVIGIILCIGAYLYEWMRLKDKKIEEIEMRLDTHIYPPRI